MLKTKPCYAAAAAAMAAGCCSSVDENRAYIYSPGPLISWCSVLHLRLLEVVLPRRRRLRHCDGRLRLLPLPALTPVGYGLSLVGGQLTTLNLPLLKTYSIVGVFSGAWADRYPAEAAAAAEKVMALVGEGKLRPRIDRVLPLEGAAEAISAIAQRAVIGRIVLQVR